MTDTIGATAGCTTLLPAGIESRDLHTVLDRRRSIRRLEGGPFTPEIRGRLASAVQLTPAAFNLPPWHVVLIHENRADFWDVVEAEFRERLSEDRLARYIERLNGFRPGVAVALVFEDVHVRPRLQESWQISEEQASAFVQQGIGMVQLAIWLSLTGDGLVTSLQHWDWLVEDRLAAFTGLPGDQFKLAAILPIGYAAEAPRPIERTPIDQALSFERWPGAAESAQ